LFDLLLEIWLMKIDLVDGTTVMSVICTTVSLYANFMPIRVCVLEAIASVIEDK